MNELEKIYDEAEYGSTTRNHPLRHALGEALTEIERLDTLIEEVKGVLTKHTEVRYSPDGEKAVLIDPEMYDAILEDLLSGNLEHIDEE